MEVPRLANYACALPPSDVCFVGQKSEDGQKPMSTSLTQ